MKPLFLTFTLLIFSTLPLISQIDFEKGYVIDNKGIRKDCLIKNKQWRNNPTEIEYKLEENSKVLTGYLRNISEFGIDGIKAKYIRFKVEIDRASSLAADFSRIRKAEFKTEMLFLKVLVEGKARLFSYYDDNLERFFFINDSSKIQQLVYKQYTTDGIHVKSNLRFQQQLFNSLKCGKPLKHTEIEYEKDELSKVFIGYNKCIGSETTTYNKKDKPDFRLSLKPGLNLRSLDISTANRNPITLQNQMHFRFGVSGEFVLNFNNKKWSVILEPSYQYLNASVTLEDVLIISPVTINLDVSYQSIEIPVGVRHYFFLSEHSKLFVNGFLIYYIPQTNVDFEYEFSNGNITTQNANDSFNNWSAEVGAGYSYKRFSGEVRLPFRRNILIEDITWTGHYQGLSLILGYQLF